MHVIDCKTNRQWEIGFRDHVLEVIETRTMCWNKASGKMVPEPIKAWDGSAKFVPVRDE